MSENQSIESLVASSDFVFLGLGAANSLIIWKLFEAGCLQHKTIGIVDPRIGNEAPVQNDKTFCFWSSTAELNHLGLTNLVSHNWDKISVNGIESELKNRSYFQVSSQDLQQFTHEILQQVKVIWYKGEWNQTDNLILEKSKNQPLIFDSRPPEYAKATKRDSQLWQSFVGFEVQLKQDRLSKSTFTMMDFRIPQQGYTQFMYVLPTSASTALFELTRFDERLIDENQATQFLEEYIRESYGDFQLLRKEKGAIPMFSTAVLLDENSPFIPTGTRATMVKASTGYAFKNMCRDALEISNNIKNGLEVTQHRASLKGSARFDFYDRLLLKVIRENPSSGHQIFSRLFQQVSANRVLTFLEQKSSLIQEIPILWSLPKRPFLKACFQDFQFGIFENPKRFFPLALALILLGSHYFNVPILGWTALAFGLVLVGMPHGAIDHVLQTRDIKTSFRLSFFLQYLSLMGLMGIIWYLNAALGLMVFLLYSAWHFGEGDFEDLGLKSSWKSWLWGVFLLAGVLLTHVEEFNDFLPLFSLGMLPEGLSTSVPFGFNEVVLIGISFMSLLVLGNRRYRPLLTVILGLVVGYFLPLIWAFGWYFIGYHSWNGWQQLKRGLNVDHYTLWRWSLPFSVAAYVMLGLFIGLVPTGATENWVAFFIFISCVSFPHVWEMRKFYAHA